jgi:hypothetical protein
MEKRISDPDAVRQALQATGLSQAGFGRLLGESQSQVCRWSKGASLSPWQHRMILRIGKVEGDATRVLYFLMSEDRIEEALGVCLGAPLPEVAPLTEVEE